MKHYHVALMYGESTYLGSAHDDNIKASEALNILIKKAKARGYKIKYFGLSVFIESFFTVVHLKVQDCVLGH